LYFKQKEYFLTMIELSFLRRFSLYIVIVSLVFGILNFFKIQYQFYLWEIFIDLKIMLLFATIVFLYKKKQIILSQNQMTIVSFDWRKNILLFFIPTLLYIMSILAGLALKEITINKLDNAATLILASLFDIPAIYVFSITTILIEEMVFRGILFNSLHQVGSKMSAALFSSLIWTVFASSEIPGVEEIDIGLIFILVLYYASLGLFLSALMDRYKSIWPGYSVRMGIITLTPITLSSHLVESDSFFKASTAIFSAEGIVLSILMIVSAILLLRMKNVEHENVLP